jgi:hypothetical protein
VSGPRVAALFHERERGARRVGYKLWHLAERWRERGIAFEAVFGLGRAPEADVWINHLDLTFVPGAYAGFLASRPRAVNARVTDLSKRAVSKNLLTRDDAWAGPVIVKSDLNHGGVPERRTFGPPGAADDPRARRGWGSRLRFRRARILRELDRRGCVDPSGYAVFDSLREVPGGVWSEPALVVERLLLERDGPYYCGRCHLFFGDRSLSLRKWGTAPVLRARSVTRMEPIPDSPEVVAHRARLGMDYGKFDYVVHDGLPHLLDASRTPTFAFADAPLPAFDRGMIETLAGGIDAWLTVPAR